MKGRQMATIQLRVQTVLNKPNVSGGLANCSARQAINIVYVPNERLIEALEILSETEKKLKELNNAEEMR
jgi:hypothetical protein